MERIQFLPPGHAERADLAVLTVGWNVKDHLIYNIEKLLESEGTIKVEIILIDNASHDGSTAAVAERYPMVRVIANDINVGFAVANMQGMLVAHARHALLLNPDMVVEPDALQKTVEYLDAHPDVAVVSGRLTSSTGEIVKSVRRFPDVWSQLLIILKLPHLLPGILNRYLNTNFDYSSEQEVEVVRGSYFAIHERAIEKLGGLDTRYFIWFEEVDYCKRAISRGMKVMYAPMIRATDLVGQSFAQTKRFLSQKRFTKSLIQYFDKWHSWWEVALLWVARWIGLGLSWLGDQWLTMKGAKEFYNKKT